MKGLKSGYYHIDIDVDYQKFLGFSWELGGVTRYFEFNVLPFGLASAPYLFTKVMRPLVTLWRSAGILIAVYLDDGFCVIPSTTNDNEELNLQVSKEVSKHIRNDLLRAGMIYNIKKSRWTPSSCTEWLGMKWDTVAGTLQVLQRRIDKIKQSIHNLQQTEPNTVRQLHSFVGQMISLSPVCGTRG